MAEPQIVNTLRSKRDDIEAAILAYEKRLEQARRDLAHVNATLALFEATDDAGTVKAYMDTSRLFPRGEIGKLCRTTLAQEGPLDTRELAWRVATAKGLDASDAVLRKALAYRIVQALTLQWKRGVLGSDGVRKGVRMWRV